MARNDGASLRSTMIDMKPPLAGLRLLFFLPPRHGRTCDQEYVMNADGSDQHMVSTGKGVTTCGYFTSDNQHIIYASTHEGGNACPMPPDRSKGYVWSIYPSFD